LEVGFLPSEQGLLHSAPAQWAARVHPPPCLDHLGAGAQETLTLSFPQELLWQMAVMQLHLAVAMIQRMAPLVHEQH
jgi:hypothetical protein